MRSRPEPPAPAFQQLLYGFPRGEFTADTLDLDGKSVVPGGLTLKVVDVTFDSSYPTGGEAVSANDVQLASITDAICNPAVKSDNSNAYVVQWDKPNGKLKLYRAADTAVEMEEATNAADLSTYTARVAFIGHRVG